MLVGSRAPPQVIFKHCDTVKTLVGGGVGGCCGAPGAFVSSSSQTGDEKP